MVVPGLALVDPVLVRRHPREVAGEPVAQPVAFGGRQKLRGLEHGNRPSDFDQMNGVDDPGAPSGEASFDCLRVEQMRGHLRRFVGEPGAKMPPGVIGKARLFGDGPCRRQCRHLHAEAHQRGAMGHEVAGVALAVTLDVGTVGVLRVRPPVVTLGEVVVLAAAAPRAAGGGHRHRCFAEIPLCRAQNALAIDRLDVECLRSQSPPFERDQPGGGRQKTPATPHGRVLYPPTFAEPRENQSGPRGVLIR